MVSKVALERAPIGNAHTTPEIPRVLAFLNTKPRQRRDSENV